MLCEFGSRGNKPCQNEATQHHTPESYARYLTDGFKIEHGFKNTEEVPVTQEMLDRIGKWCDEHAMPGMVPIGSDRSIA